MAIISSVFAVTFTAQTLVDVNVSSTILDARVSIPCLYDSTGAVVLTQITAISATTFRITSEAALTGNYTLVVVGAGTTPPPAPAPSSALMTAPTLPQLLTYKDYRTKLEADLDLEDEEFIKPNELIGYVNEGIDEAEAEILKLDEDYFLTSMPMPLIQGQTQYDYPPNIYAYKIRGIEYSNGSQIYDVRRFRRGGKFNNVAFAEQYSQADDYRWYHTNDSAGAAKINLVPAARETAVVPPSANPFMPMTVWYIRHANRVPLLGQFILNWEILDQIASINVATSTFTNQNSYVTGDQVKLTSTGSMPGGLTKNTVYYVIVGMGYIKLATTLQNAKAGVSINLTSAGTGLLAIAIAASQSIVDNTVIDIPEYGKFILQWAKCRCLEKDGSPKLAGAVQTLEQQRAQMVSTLTEAQPDDQNLVEADFTPYTELS